MKVEANEFIVTNNVKRSSLYFIFMIKKIMHNSCIVLSNYELCIINCVLSKSIKRAHEGFVFAYCAEGKIGEDCAN